MPPPENRLILDPEISGLWIEILWLISELRTIVPVTFTAPPLGSWTLRSAPTVPTKRLPPTVEAPRLTEPAPSPSIKVALPVVLRWTWPNTALPGLGLE